MSQFGSTAFAADLYLLFTAACIQPSGTLLCRSTRALHFCGQESLEAAVTWLSDHADDTGLDEPLLVPKVSSIIWHQTGPFNAKVSCVWCWYKFSIADGQADLSDFYSLLF